MPSRWPAAPGPEEPAPSSGARRPPLPHQRAPQHQGYARETGQPAPQEEPEEPTRAHVLLPTLRSLLCEGTSQGPAGVRTPRAGAGRPGGVRPPPPHRALLLRPPSPEAATPHRTRQAGGVAKGGPGWMRVTRTGHRESTLGRSAWPLRSPGWFCSEGLNPCLSLSPPQAPQGAPRSPPWPAA